MAKVFEWKYEDLIKLNNMSSIFIDKYNISYTFNILVEYLEEYIDDNDMLKKVNNIVRCKAYDILYNYYDKISRDVYKHILYNMDKDYLKRSSNDLIEYMFYYYIWEGCLSWDDAYEFITYILNNSNDTIYFSYFYGSTPIYIVKLFTDNYDKIHINTFNTNIIDLDGITLEFVKDIIDKINILDINYETFINLCNIDNDPKEVYKILKYFLDDIKIPLYNNRFAGMNQLFNRLILSNNLTLETLKLLNNHISIPNNILEKLIYHNKNNLEIYDWVLKNMKVDKQYILYLLTKKGYSKDSKLVQLIIKHGGSILLNEKIILEIYLILMFILYLIYWLF